MAVLKLPVEEGGTVRMTSERGWIRGSCVCLGQQWEPIAGCSLGTRMPSLAGFLVSKGKEKL